MEADIPRKAVDPGSSLVGLPREGFVEEDSESPRATQKVLSDRFDLNQSRAVSPMPTQCSNQDMRIPWSTVSSVRSKCIISTATRVANQKNVIKDI